MPTVLIKTLHLLLNLLDFALLISPDFIAKGRGMLELFGYLLNCFLEVEANWKRIFLFGSLPVN